MDIAALLTSAGINVGVCVAMLGCYSVLRKQPSNKVVYFGRRLASVRLRTRRDPFSLERFVPSPSWIVKAWEVSEDDILSIGGMDAVVFQRILVFSIRAFAIAAVLCVFCVLPANYYGRYMEHKEITYESIDVFSITNVREGSSWLWVHCLALYIITISACLLLYFEFKSITKMRLAHLTRSSTNPGHFTILVRSIPWVPGESYSDTVGKFFMNYYPSSYLSHQMVYRSGLVHQLMDDAGKVCNMIKAASLDKPSLCFCCFCAQGVNSFKRMPNSIDSVKDGGHFPDVNRSMKDQEVPAAFVFYKSRLSAVLTTQILQSANPMAWVTELAPEPHDVLWSNLSIPYRQLWIRKIATLIAAVVLMFVFLMPVTFVQGLTQLEKISKMMPFLRGLLKKDIMNHIITGYLPSVVLMLFLYTVPPTMMLFSSVEGPVSRSARKKSACLKILYFTIWNVFFVNVLSGTVISQLNVFSSVRDIPTQLAKAVPTQASFFLTYILTSGWAGVACELMQLFPLICNAFRKWILRKREDSKDGLLSFPYHTEVPRVLLFCLLGFTFSIMAPILLPFLLFYFVLGYFVYRNQIVNVYISKYDSGGQFWPVAHTTIIFSLVLAQVIALGVFGIKESPVASGFTIPLIICTLLFNEYCRRRFLPIFRKDVAEVLIEMDRQDLQSGRMEEIHRLLDSAYCQFPLTAQGCCESSCKSHEDDKSVQDPEAVNVKQVAGHEQSETNAAWTNAVFVRQVSK